MPPDDLGALARLPDLVTSGALVLCRVAGVVAVMPGLGEAEPPMVVRVGVALTLTLLVAPLVKTLDLASSPPLEIVRLVVTEAACGLFIGWLARLIAMALPIAGQFISVFAGLTSVVQPDPEFGAQASALARLFSLVAPVLILSSGLFVLPLQALSSSYQLIPIGAGVPSADQLGSVLLATTEAFGIGFRLAAPFLLIATVWQVSLSVVARLAPAMQVGSVLAPGQLLGGLLLLAVVTRLTIHAWFGDAQSDLSALSGLLDAR